MPGDIPSAYEGREQTYLKHRALSEYVVRWAIKVGSVAVRTPGRLKLWYCDVFSGPWKTRDEQKQDCSIWIGLEAMLRAQKLSKGRSAPFEIGAVFVEKNRAAFEELRELCREFDGRVDTHPLLGRFQDHIGQINRLVAGSMAFVFVDPTGWKGAAMYDVAKLAKENRDILIRVPEEAYRFMSRKKIRKDLLRFLGSDHLQPNMSQEELVSHYCERLKEVCSVNYSAEMAVPRPDRDRISSWLVVGGNHPQVLNVFREVEEKTVGAEARDVREFLRRKRTSPGQSDLFEPRELARYDRFYEERLARAVREIPDDLAHILRSRGPMPYRDLWPELLERHHVSLRSLSRVISASGIVVDGMGPRQQLIKDDQVLRPSPELDGMQADPEEAG